MAKLIWAIVFLVCASGFSCSFCSDPKNQNAPAQNPPPTTSSPSAQNTGSAPIVVKGPQVQFGKLQDGYLNSVGRRPADAPSERGSFDFTPVIGDTYQSGGSSSDSDSGESGD